LENHAKLTPRNTDLLKNGKTKDFLAKPKSRKPSGLTEIPIPPVSANFQINPEPVAPVEPKKPLKIALIGTAPSSRHLAPFNDPEWTIWACSPGNQGNIPRVDAWFEVHSNLLWPECEAYGKPYIEWLKQQTFPIYMQDQRLIPHAISLPIQELVTEFGKYFFTSSFAYMLAMAIKAGASEIALFGIDMASKDEYILQRPGGHYFMQEAAKRGIKVSVPFESDLAQPPALYAYDDSTPFGRKYYVREKELTDRITTMVAERDKLNHGITFLQGALEDMNYWRSIWSGIQT